MALIFAKVELCRVAFPVERCIDSLYKFFEAVSPACDGIYDKVY